MDRGTFILAAGFTIMVGVYTLNMTRADMGTKGNSDVFAYKHKARQIALTGVALAANQMRYNSAWMTGYQNKPLLEGALNVVVDSTGLPTGQRRVTSSGSYYGHTYSAVGFVQVPPSNRNFDLSQLSVQTALEMQGRTISIQPSNKFFVNGNDWVADSIYDPVNTKFGIGASPQLTKATVSTALANAGAQNKVIGLGTNPSVTTLSSVVNMRTLDDEIKRISTIIHKSGTLGRERSWGTVNSPEIVYVSKSLTIDKPLTGAGILLIDGNITVRNSVTWYGYVIVFGNSFIVQSSGNITVKGAVFFGKEDRDLKFGSAGNMNIGYSSGVLQTVNAKMFVAAGGKPSIVRIFEKPAP